MILYYEQFPTTSHKFIDLQYAFVLQKWPSLI